MMDELLGNPAVQAGVAPFLVSLAVAAVLSRTRFMAIAQVAGFLTLAALAIGFSFESLTATKKLVLIGAATAVAACVLEARGKRRAVDAAAVLGLLAIGCVWMMWRLLAQKEAGPAVAAAVMAIGYAIAVVGGTLHVSSDPARGAAAGLMLGLGTGALAVLGASAVLGLVGISVGAAAGATLLVQMLRGQSAPPGWTLALPASTIAALAGVLAVVSASLPWYCLLPVVAAPWATVLVPSTLRPFWLRAFLYALAALVPMAIAVAIAWTASTPA